MSTFYLTPYSSRKEDLFENMFNQLFQYGISDRAVNHNTRINENNDTITLNLDVPGFEKKEISIDYKDDQLFIEAKSEERNEIKHQYTVRNIDIKKSTAELNNGVLTLKLEKSSSAKKQVLTIS